MQILPHLASSSLTKYKSCALPNRVSLDLQGRTGSNAKIIRRKVLFLFSNKKHQTDESTYKIARVQNM